MALEMNIKTFGDNIPIETIESIAEDLKRRFRLRIAHKEELRFIGAIAALEYKSGSNESMESFIAKRMLDYAKKEKTYDKSTVLISSMNKTNYIYGDTLNESSVKISPFAVELSEESQGAIAEVFLKGMPIDSLDFYIALDELAGIIKKQDPEDGNYIIEKLLILASRVDGNPSYEDMDMMETYPTPKEVAKERRKVGKIQ